MNPRAFWKTAPLESVQAVTRKTLRQALRPLSRDDVHMLIADVLELPDKEAHVHKLSREQCRQLICLLICVRYL